METFKILKVVIRPKFTVRKGDVVKLMAVILFWTNIFCNSNKYERFGELLLAVISIWTSTFCYNEKYI